MRSPTTTTRVGMPQCNCLHSRFLGEDIEQREKRGIRSKEEEEKKGRERGMKKREREAEVGKRRVSKDQERK